MDRTFLKLGPITIYWYSVLIISAILIGLYFASKQAEKNKLGKEFIIDLSSTSRGNRCKNILCNI